MTPEGANAAWLLGDRRLPPIGSWIRVLSSRPTRGVLWEGELLAAWQQQEIHGSKLVLRLLGEGGAMQCNFWWRDVIEIVLLPEGCPPFEEWVRYEGNGIFGRGLVSGSRSALRRMGLEWGRYEP